jgi:hypothetical protein
MQRHTISFPLIVIIGDRLQVARKPFNALVRWTVIAISALFWFEHGKHARNVPRLCFEIYALPAPDGTLLVLLSLFARLKLE